MNIAEFDFDKEIGEVSHRLNMSLEETSAFLWGEGVIGSFLKYETLLDCNPTQDIVLDTVTLAQDGYWVFDYQHCQYCDFSKCYYRIKPVLYK